MEGYNKAVEKCIKNEFPHLNGISYLDHTGTTLYAASQLMRHHEDLLGNVYGNPHSRSVSSQLTTDTIEQVRYRILQHFNTTPDHHSVIFTSGCTGALKLLCNTFDWSACNINKTQRTLSTSTTSHNAFETTHDVYAATHNGLETTHHSSLQNGYEQTGVFCYLEDNHTSVIGMREIAKEKGANVFGISVENIESRFQTSSSQKTFTSKTCNCLFAYPGQSNFCGRKYPLDWIRKVKQGHLSSSSNYCCQGNWYVVFDAAAMAATSPLDLGNCPADFVTISFYKMFGYPTGLGALIVKKGAECALKKTYFGGGTVLAYTSGEQFHASKTSITEWFEDGTVPFLDIIAVRHGLDTLERIAGDMSSIQQHTFAVAKYVHDKMAAFRHGNGSVVAKLYCHGDFQDMDRQGPIVNFNLLRPNGDFVGYAEVDSLAALHDIHLRTGCFCNTGACQRYLGLSSQQIKDNFQAGHVCGDEVDIINGQPTGSVRISFGYMSTKADADNFLKFVTLCFVKQGSVHQADTQVSNVALTSLSEEPQTMFCTIDGCHGNTHLPCGVDSAKKAGSKTVLTNIFVYPIKSCGAMEVTEWELGPRGLLYDRHWMIVNNSGVCLSQKREKKLCLIKPTVDLQAGVLKMSYSGLHPVEVALDLGQTESRQATVSKVCHSQVCGDRVAMLDCGDTAARWLEGVLGKPCRLLQQNPNFQRECKLKEAALSADQQPQLSLVQESPYLLLNRASCKELIKAIQQKQAHTAADGELSESHMVSTQQEKGFADLENFLGRFRGNLVIDNVSRFQEDEWKKVQIGRQVFLVGGLCSRCQMICVNQDTAERSMEPLLTLASFRGKKVPFGIHLLRDPSLSTSTTISVNDAITVLQVKT